MLYFASLKTDEGRRILCTVNYVDPAESQRPISPDDHSDRSMFAPFDRPLPFDVRTLRKLGRAADPAVSSLAVWSDRKRNLFIWGMVDQEPRYGDSIMIDSPGTSDRPGLFQAIVTGPGNLSVYFRNSLLGSLVQNALVEEHHNVLWSGPVHAILRENLKSTLAGHWRWKSLAVMPDEDLAASADLTDDQALLRELLIRWVNAVCRLLVSVQKYRHGGGLLIVPDDAIAAAYVNYVIHYDRLPRSLLALVEGRVRRDRATNCEQMAQGTREVERRRQEALGAIRFIAALSCVDGVVVLDRGLRVQGFGVELRAQPPLAEIHLAGDVRAAATPLRRVDLTHFGTRHRAMMRYCHQRPGTLGFAVSQDGEIRAMTRLDDRLVVWENIDVQLAVLGEPSAGPDASLVMRRFISRDE
jgi:hypothetical protein